MATIPLTAQGPRPGFLFFVCPDAQILRERAEDEAAAYAAAGDGSEVIRHCFWGDEAPPRAFWDALTVAGLFSVRRLVLVRQANRWPAAVWHTLEKALSRPRKGVLPIFCLEGEWGKARWNSPAEPKIPAVIARLACWRFAEGRGWIWRDEGLTDSNIRAHILKSAQRRGLRLSQQAVMRLAEGLPRSAEVVDNELEKLSLLPEARERVLGVDDLATASWLPDANIFACLDALFSGNVATLWKQAALIQDRDAAVFLLLTLVSNNLRQLWKDQAGEIVAFKGLSKKIMPQLGDRLGHSGIRDALCLVVDTEKAIKTGQCAPDQALDSFLSRMLAITRRPAARR